MQTIYFQAPHTKMSDFAHATCKNAHMNSKTNWDDFKTTLALIKHGTLAKAAAELNVTYTTVARRIARLEERLGERLFERLADGYQPTEYAHLVATQAETMRQAEDSLFRQLQLKDKKLSGPFTITSPQLVINYFLLPVLQEFKSAYPDIDLYIRATNDFVDLTRREADVAVRPSQKPGESLKGLRISEQKNTWFASKELVEKLEKDATYPFHVITYKAYSSLPAGFAKTFPNAKISYTMDDMIAIHGAAKSGLGAARMPLFLGSQTPELKRLPHLTPQPYSDVWLVAHPDIWTSAKVTAFKKIVLKHMKQKKTVFTGL